MAQTIYRFDDGMEWESIQQAENHEKRMLLIREKLKDIGGRRGLASPSLKIPSVSEVSPSTTRRRIGFMIGFVRRIACEMEEVVALAAVLKPILDECGANPYPLNY